MPSPEDIPPFAQVDAVLRSVVGGADGERMTLNKVGEGSEAASYILHDAQLETSSHPELASATQAPTDQAARVVEQSIHNRTLKGLLDDIIDAA